IKAAYLHAASDTLVSVGVVISGVIIRFSGWDIIDPILSLLISLIIAIPSIKLFLSALHSLRITKSS
ncbi:MAG: cation transporter, partial [Candidatus Cryptobacteroides sp.]